MVDSEDFSWESNETYLSLVYDIFQKNNPRYTQTLEEHLNFLNASHSILDLGSGTGLFVEEFLRRNVGPNFIYCMDISSTALDILQKKCSIFPQHNVEIEQIDLSKISQEKFNLHSRKYGGVNSMIALPFIENCENFISFGRNSLHTRGKMIVTSWAPEKDILYGVAEINEQILRGNGTLDHYQREWDHLKSKMPSMAEVVVNSKLTEELLGDILQKNFELVKRIQNPYGKYAITYQAEIPN